MSVTVLYLGFGFNQSERDILAAAAAAELRQTDFLSQAHLLYLWELELSSELSTSN